MKKKLPEIEYDFTLVLTGIDGLTPEVVEALAESGCDDGTLAMRSGRPYITFSRSAASMKDAILSAIADVRKANIGADVLRVDDCNLVTQSDIARRIGRSRQLVYQYMTGERGDGDFPAPACHITDKAPLWFWCEVAYWLWRNNLVKESILRDAEEVDTINNVLELNRRKQENPELAREVIGVVSPHICQ